MVPLAIAVGDKFLDRPAQGRFTEEDHQDHPIQTLMPDGSHISS
jgi:hypothetical protein